MIAMLFVVFFLNMSVILSRGEFWYPLIFLKPNFGLKDTYIGVSAGKLTRWSVAGPLVALYLVPAFLWPFSGRKNYIRYAVFILFSLVAALMSGGRFHLITLGYFVCIFSVLTSKKTLRAIGGLLVFGCVSYGVLILLAPILPFGAQRTLSVVPGMRVSAAAAQSAQQTLFWRYELWNMFLENLHKYMFIGRGFGFSPAEHQSSMMNYGFVSLWHQVYSTYVGGHSHQGILDLVFFLGLPGCVLFLFWILAEVFRHIRLQKGAWLSPAFKQYHLALTAYFITIAAQHFTIHGGIRTFLGKLIFLMALLQAIVVSDRKLQKKEEGGYGEMAEDAE